MHTEVSPTTYKGRNNIEDRYRWEYIKMVFKEID
jgi:hypothetical protein